MSRIVFDPPLTATQLESSIVQAGLEKIRHDARLIELVNDINIVVHSDENSMKWRSQSFSQNDIEWGIDLKLMESPYVSS